MKSISALLVLFFLPVSLVASTDYESQARLALREMRTIVAAVDRYNEDHNTLPPTLQALVPTYLDYLPASPWGWQYRYLIVSASNYHVAVKLPTELCGAWMIDLWTGRQLQVWAGEQWRAYPACALTDEEKHVLATNELHAVASAVEDYRAEYNVYPTSLTQLAPYITYIAGSDPWGNPYSYALSADGYTLSSYAADAAEGGCGFSQDIMFQSSFPYSQTLHYGTPAEYLLDAWPKLLGVAAALESYMVDYNVYPPSLQDIVPTYLASPSELYDQYNHLMIYHLLTPTTYLIVAPGKDGIEGTEEYELRATGVNQVTTQVHVYTVAASAGNGLFEGGLLPQCPAAKQQSQSQRRQK